MPKLSPLYWLLLVVFLAFYGFAVFAVTRDYYVRHPVRPVATQAAPGTSGGPTGHPAVGTRAMDATNAIPQTITETNPDLLRQRAGTLFAERRFALAIPVYRRILELAADDVETRNDLGLALFYTGDTTGALDTLRQATRDSPQGPRLWLSLGYVALQAGDRPTALEALGRARDLGPDTQIGQEATRLLNLSQDAEK
ncbi:MAG TPA: tetratricopeptide repeat protein [Lamprocystis sp. (in: g-proteobacteria)]|nr:tetratricopeptide repeat protein [Lamprocystis sp. (in: g-proteobacteria)]